MLGLGLGLTHHRYFKPGGRMLPGYVQLRALGENGERIPLRARLEHGRFDLLAQVA